MLSRLQRTQMKWYGNLLRRMIVIGRRKSTSGSRTVGGEVEDRNNPGRVK